MFFNSDVTHSLSDVHRAERATTGMQLYNERKGAESPGLETYSTRAQLILLLTAHSPVRFKGKKGDIRMTRQSFICKLSFVL